jgi:hypothetical protein
VSYFDPKRLPTLPARRREAARHQLEQVVERAAQARRRSPAVVTAVLLAVVLSTGAAAAAIAAFQPVTNKAQARCYTVADLAGGRYTTIATPGRTGSSAQVRDTLTVCAALFRQGFLSVGGRGIDAHADGRADHRVPVLVVCTMPDGTASVFPGDAATCAKLGLPVASNRSTG